MPEDPIDHGDGWLLLIARLPARPSSVRVRVWRRLRALGAVALKNSVYVLPDSADHREQLEWLAQEIQEAGEATLVHTRRIENVAPADLVRLFQEARGQEYRELAARYRAVLRQREARGGGATVARLGRELDRVRAIDFFDSAGYREAQRLREVAEARLGGRPATGDGAAAPLVGAGGRRWVTRPRPHVDRLASAWLITRFLDPRGEILFADPEALPPDAIAFDVAGAELGHHGDDCTFETLLKRSGLRDPALAAIAAIVHEADLHDQKFERQEAPGIDLAVRSLVAALPDDHALLAHGLTLFDGLHATLVARAGRGRKP